MAHVVILIEPVQSSSRRRRTGAQASSLAIWGIRAPQGKRDACAPVRGTGSVLRTMPDKLQEGSEQSGRIMEPQVSKDLSFNQLRSKDLSFNQLRSKDLSFN